MTIDKYSWGYRRNARSLDVYTIQNLITHLVETVCFGGKYLHSTLKNIIVTTAEKWYPSHTGDLFRIFSWRMISNTYIITNGKSYNFIYIYIYNYVLINFTYLKINFPIVGVWILFFIHEYINCEYYFGSLFQ